ncbi:DUF2790 domain-containing protein [Pseudomonas jinjuensis]|uniref:Topoisomerase II n=1 Tax=Pseudomonas jinjuensis TaxID=198616 RepID=A0A1G9YK29_9PSED|nr:DUF2790 domain-containing protein [Pseudomonas jinjuensis]SDN09477.1 Protein of unknown function [Pseudomonas jinjuensis]
MKAAFILALAGFSSFAFADEANADSVAVEQYTYDMKLDIARVISNTDVSSQCGVVPARMTYEDSQGQRHTIQYQVWGGGCSGG